MIARLFCVLSPLFAILPVVAEPLRIPAFTAYGEPDPNALHFTRSGDTRNWNGQTLLWFGKLVAPGVLKARITGTFPNDALPVLKLSIFPVGSPDKSNTLTATPASGEGEMAADFASAPLTVCGYYCFKLEAANAGEAKGEISALILDGAAAAGAQFSTVERRNAASVHLGYPIPDKAKAAWFYNQVCVRTEPVTSFYMACGFDRGYFGIQVNSPTERRILFSVWDSGNEGNDRRKVADDDKVKLLAKGEGVIAKDFGNEGTGGQSYLVFPWKKDVTYHFLLGAQPEGGVTIYSAYFYFPDKKQWGLIATFQAPKAGGYLRGLHSFNENFWGNNGYLQRLAEYGPQWIRTPEGTWKELLEAHFTHDGHGEKMRHDYMAGVKGTAFYLSNGGFLAEPRKYGDVIKRAASGEDPPEILQATGSPLLGG